MSADADTVTVYFDGSCPLCRAEIAHYRSLQGAGRLGFVDVSQADACIPSGLARETLMARFHVRRSDGLVVSGATAFVAIWRLLPGWRWAARIAGLPGATAALEAAYRRFLPMRPALAAMIARRQPSRLACPDMPRHGDTGLDTGSMPDQHGVRTQ
jgi:predicted DCC family thiol-disulfide oxidoreductase YuxK